MRATLFLVVVATAYIASAVPVLEEKQLETKEYPRFIEMPDPEGNMHLVDLEAEPDMEALNELNRDGANNAYLLFTRQNRLVSQTLTINNAQSVANSNFDATKPIVVIVHGWLGSRYAEPNPSIREAYLDKYDVNVIVACWSLRANLDYVSAARGVPSVGRGIGQFLNWLNSETGAPFEQMHLVGFSLGAHVVGNAGRETGGRVARVTGLDAAGPLFHLNSERLNANDGRYVEVIHTTGDYTVGGLGIGTALGDIDFFPNGGVSQPGCLTHICNHNRAWELFAATVTHDHLVGRKCDNNLQLNLNLCRGDELNMGNSELSKTGSGIYRVNTARNYPY